MQPAILAARPTEIPTEQGPLGCGRQPADCTTVLVSHAAPRRSQGAIAFVVEFEIRRGGVAV
jgi:hypothetical protein